jgi:hypothetical protein
MSAPPSFVVPIQALPFAILPLIEAASLNPVLQALFTTRAASQADGPQVHALRYVGRDDLTESRDPQVQSVLAGIFRAIVAVVREVNALDDVQLRAFTMQTRAWFTIVQPDGCLPPANHPLSAWCAIYCVAGPPSSATRADSGLLRILESRLSTTFADATTADMRLPYRPGHYAWRPMPGQVAIFPAGLLHEIAPLRASEPLVLVTVRARFIAPRQEGVGRW